MARRGTLVGQLLDAVAYAVVVAAIAFVAASAVSFALGFEWVGVKYALFFVGILGFGYATFTLRPTPPWKRDDDEPTTSQPSVDERDETRVQAIAQEVPPARFYQVPVDERLPDGVKVFLASLAILATSAAMEYVFGVAVSAPQ